MTLQEETQAIAEERDRLKSIIDGINTEAPSEAGFSMNFQISHDVIGPAQVTFRGTRSNDWSRVMASAKEFSAYAMANGWKFKQAPQAAPPPKVAPQDHDDPQPKQLSTDGVPALPEGAKAWQTISATKVIVKPEPGDLVTIEFYAAGHKWPDLKANKWKLERAQGFLKHVTSHDVRKPAELALSCIVYYLNGKEKADKPGEFWKDVYHVRPDNF